MNINIFDWYTRTRVTIIPAHKNCVGFLRQSPIPALWIKKKAFCHQLWKFRIRRHLKDLIWCKNMKLPDASLKFVQGLPSTFQGCDFHLMIIYDWWWIQQWEVVWFLLGFLQSWTPGDALSQTPLKVDQKNPWLELPATFSPSRAEWWSLAPVSYTHLTLPTILLV